MVVLPDTYEVNQETGCWLWTGYITDNGYGRISDQFAHRLSYAAHYGDIPDGMHVLHKCDVKPCVNPSHLFLGTNNDNVADRVAKDRSARGMGHGLAKLTKFKVLAIRESNRTQKQLARIYGVDQTSIGNILRRKTWSHV